MSEELYCNFKKCRRALKDYAYITACSHAFCQDHGQNEILVKNEKICPACQTRLVNNFDFVKANLSPSEQFKSMVLAGHRPDVIMDIANRAISFWSYQQYQEHLQKDVIIKNLKESVSTETENNKAEVNLLQTDLENLKRRKKELEDDLEIQKAKVEEIMEKMSEKTRENQKLQTLCESLKKRQLTATVLQEQHSNTASRQNKPPEFDFPLLGPTLFGGGGPPAIYSRDGPAALRQSPKPKPAQNVPPREEVFDFCPEFEGFPSPKVFIDRGYKTVRK